MNKTGPIIIIEDDLDDQELLTSVFTDLNYKNKVLFFGDSYAALDHLTNTDVEPFLVLSDINMPKLNGMELREKVHNNEDLRLKSIPYLFSRQAQSNNMWLTHIHVLYKVFSLNQPITKL